MAGAACHQGYPAFTCYDPGRGGVFFGKPVGWSRVARDLCSVILLVASRHVHRASRRHTGGLYLIRNVVCPGRQTVGNRQRHLGRNYGGQKRSKRQNSNPADHKHCSNVRGGQYKRVYTGRQGRVSGTSDALYCETTFPQKSPHCAPRGARIHRTDYPIGGPALWNQEANEQSSRRIWLKWTKARATSLGMGFFLTLASNPAVRAQAPPILQGGNACCIAASAILEFDTQGNLLKS